MEHISDIDLLEYVGDRLKASKRREVQEHIEHCASCSKRYRQAAQVWDALGQWQVDTSNHSVSDKIKALVAGAGSDRRQNRISNFVHQRFLSATIRVAAAIAISAGAGHMLGKYSISENVPGAVALNDAPSYLAALGLEWSSELTWLVLEQDSPANGGSL